MTAAEFKEWRRKFGLTQAQAGARFGVSRVTIQNWESGGTPIPEIAESHWLRLKRQQPDFGPVVLHYIQHLPMRPSVEAIVGMEEEFDPPRREQYRSVGTALDRVRFLAQGLHSDFFLTDAGGVTVLSKGEVADLLSRPLGSGGFEENSTEAMESANRSPKGQRVPQEEIERRHRLIKELQAEVKKLPVLDPNFTDKDLYDEFGLPK